MPNRPITIEGIDSNGGLILSDRGKTEVDPGDTVTWIIHPRSGVNEITGIINNSEINIFSEGPSRVGNSKNWRGTVDPNIPRGSEEDYDIAYTKTGSTGSQMFDPKISVKL
jgi:plastocyanin